MSAGQKLLEYDSLRVSPVKAEPVDLRSHRRGHEPVQRLAASSAFTDLRGRDRNLGDVEELDALRSLETGEDRLQRLACEARASGNAEANLLQNTVGVLPGEEARELVRADEEKAIAEPPTSDGVDRVTVLFRHDFVARQVAKRELREAKARREVECHVSVSGIDDDEREQALEAEVVECRFGESDMAVVRRIERAAEEPCHSNSTGSPGFTPAARSSSSVASPRTR